MSKRITSFIFRLMMPALCVLLVLSGCREKKQITGDAHAVVKDAWRDYRLGEFNSAITKFESVAAETKDTDDIHIRALFGLATTWNLRRPGNDREKARGYYEEVLRLSPRNTLAAWSLLGLARMKHLVPVGQEPDYNAVRAAYREVITRFPGHLAADEAFVYLQSTYVAEMEPPAARQALKNLKAFIREHPKSGFISACYSLESICYETLGKRQKRLAAQLQALKTAEIDPMNPFQDNSGRYWEIATLAEFEAGNFDVARTFYRRLIKEYPTDIRKFGCEQALRRMDALEEKMRDELRGTAPGKEKEAGT